MVREPHCFSDSILHWDIEKRTNFETKNSLFKMNGRTDTQEF